MSTYSDIAGGISTVLEANVTGLQAEKYPPEAVNHFPTTLIIPETFDPSWAFGGNTMATKWRLITLVAAGDAPEGWTELYNMIDVTNASTSIIKALRDNPTLDGKVDTSEAMMVENIGRRQFGGGNYFGFDIILEAIKSVA